MTPAQMQAMMKDLTLKVDAQATMNAGGSRGGAKKSSKSSKSGKHVKVENKGIIMVYNDFFVLLSFKMTIAKLTTRRMRRRSSRRTMRRF